MKNVDLFLSFILLGVLSLSAQPTLTSNSIPSAGYYYYQSRVNWGNTAPGSAGPNQTWDFSALSDTGYVDTVRYVDPTTLPDFSNYPSSNLARVSAFDTSFFNKTNTSLSLVGLKLLPIFTINIVDSERIYEFPESFNDSFLDTFRLIISNVSLLPPFIPITTYSYRLSNSVIDGYGTLITSSGSYPNTLRLKIQQMSYDTIITNQSPPDTTYRQNRRTLYQWIRVADGASFPVFEMQYDTLDQTTPVVYAFHRQTDNTTNIENANSSNDFLLYPNPANNKLMISLDEDVERIVITDLTGKTVESVIPFKHSEKLFQEVDISKLTNGIYTVHTQGRKGNASQRLIKQ